MTPIDGEIGRHSKALRQSIKIAHWLIGLCDEVPDAILLCDPRKYVNMAPLEDVLVYKKEDIGRIIRDNSELSRLLNIFIHYLTLAPDNVLGRQQLFAELSAAPAILGTQTPPENPA